MAITHPAGWPISANGDFNSITANITSITMPAVYGSVADLTFFWAQTIAPYQISGVTSSNGQSSGWQQGAAYTDSTNNIFIQLWTGVAVATSAADNLTLSYTGGTLSNIWPDSLTAGLGSSTTWTTVRGGTGITGSGTTITYPSVSAFNSTNPQAFSGFAVSWNTATGTNTGGFVVIDSPTKSGNEMQYNLGVSYPNSYSPTSTQPSGFYDSLAVIFMASASSPGGYIFPPPMVALQSSARSSFL